MQHKPPVARYHSKLRKVMSLSALPLIMQLSGCHAVPSPAQPARPPGPPALRARPPRMCTALGVLAAAPPAASCCTQPDFSPGLEQELGTAGWLVQFWSPAAPSPALACTCRSRNGQLNKASTAPPSNVQLLAIAGLEEAGASPPGDRVGLVQGWQVQRRPVQRRSSVQAQHAQPLRRCRRELRQLCLPRP